MDLDIRPFDLADEDAVVQLWTDCGLVVPWNDPHRDIQRKLAVQAELFLVGRLEGRIVASAMAGYDGHRGWINYLAVHPQHRRTGIGRRMMLQAESLLRARGCPKINLNVRTSNLAVMAFYERLGYAVDDVACVSKRLISDEGNEGAASAPADAAPDYD